LKWEVNGAVEKGALSGLPLTRALFPLLDLLREFLVPSKKLR
jgi:hypothetical protein